MVYVWPKVKQILPRHKTEVRKCDTTPKPQSVSIQQNRTHAHESTFKVKKGVILVKALSVLPISNAQY